MIPFQIKIKILALREEMFPLGISVLNKFVYFHFLQTNLYIFIFFNPLLLEVFLSYFFGTLLKIGSFRLPIRSCDVHWKFFDDPFLN